MLIFFRFLMLLIGGLYKVYGKVLRKKPIFVQDANFQFEYAFIVKKNKKGMKSEIFIKDSKRIFFRILPEKRLHRILKKIGFNSELQAGDHDFDFHHYVESDHPSFRRALRHNKELQSIIIELRRLGYDSIVSLGDGLIKISSYLNSSPAPTTEQLALFKKFLDQINAVQIFRGESDPFVLKVLAFEVIYYGIGFYGISTYIIHSFDDGLYLIEPWELVLRGVFLGCIVLLAWIAISFTVLKKSSRAPVFFGEVFFGMIICLIFGGGQIMVDLNQVLDRSMPVFEKAFVVSKFSKRTGSGRRSRTTFYVNLKFKNNKYKISSPLRVSLLNYHKLHEDSGVEFTIYDGFFDSRYISSMRPVHFEIKDDTTNNIDLNELKNLATWSLPTNPDSSTEVVWHDEYYPGKKQLRQKESFVAGKRNGIGEYWHQNGRLYSKIPWVNDKKHGQFKLYREDGSLEQELSYKEGRPHGLLTWYNNNGSIYAQAIYRDGEVLESDMEKLKKILSTNQP